MKKILGIGNALCDVLSRVDESFLEAHHLPKGSTQFVDLKGYQEMQEVLEEMDSTLASGGSTGNCMLALANLGAEPGFIGKIGNDRYGDFYKDNFQRHGGIPHFMVDECPTGVALTFITPDGQRTFNDYLGAAATLVPEDLQPDWFEKVDLCYIEGYLVQNHALIRKAVELAKERNIKVALDFSAFNIIEEEHEFFQELINDIDIIFANENEAYAFTQEIEPLAALNQLTKHCETAVIKLGKDGAMAKNTEGFAQMAASTVHKVVDTTGAGDYFAAGFLYGYLNNEPLSNCLRKGTILASEVIQVVGTTIHQDTWDLIRKKL